MKDKIPAWAIAKARRTAELEGSGRIKNEVGIMRLAMAYFRCEPDGIFKREISDGLRECSDEKVYPPARWTERFGIDQWCRL